MFVLRCAVDDMLPALLQCVLARNFRRSILALSVLDGWSNGRVVEWSSRELMILDLNFQRREYIVRERFIVGRRNTTP